MRNLILAAIAITLPTTAAAQDWAVKLLEASPRHGEWVNIKAGKRTVKTFVVYPESKSKAPVIVVIHEIFGLTDWVRRLADELASHGYIALAPDLLSGSGSSAGQDSARQTVGSLPPEQVTSDLNAVADYGLKLPACNGKLSVTGYCWGGTQSFRFATNRSDLKAAYVFYGSAPESEEELKRINCPVYGFYAENDMRINATLDKTSAQMKQLGKTFSNKIYSGGGHGFMRAGDDPNGTTENKKARLAAWKDWLVLLKK